MAFTHWIITNRVVGKAKGSSKESILDTKKEALPTFRVATYTPPAPGGKVEFASLVRGVEVVPDHDRFDSYVEAAAAGDPAKLVGSARLFRSLYDQMCAADDAKGDTLLFLHGFNYAWPDALSHLQRLHEVYAAPADSPIRQIVYFTWPSWGELIGKYDDDQRIAAPSGQLLGRVFGQALQFYKDMFAGGGNRFCGRKIHIAAHSMGNLVMQEFMRSIREFKFLRSNLFTEALLLNADADWTAMEPGQPLASLVEFSERVHLYNHYGDDALKISETTKNNAKRLGRHGPRDLATIPPRTAIVDCSGLDDKVPSALRDSDPMVKVIKRVLGPHESSWRERMFDHWGYLHRPEVVKDVWGVLAGAPASRLVGREQKTPVLYKLKRGV